MGRAHIPVRGAKADRYASREDFRRIFDEDSLGLYQLSFLLTGNPEKEQGNSPATPAQVVTDGALCCASSEIAAISQNSKHFCISRKVL